MAGDARGAGTRREARERAVELLYEADTKSVHPEAVVADLPLRPDDYALELAYGVADHRIEIDHVLNRYARRWPVSRMAAMDRTVLRVGTFELATQLDVPRGVCLSEAVDLGGQYGSTDDTSRFVNGVLVSVADEVRVADRRPWSPIDVVVFDMDGVVRHWRSDHIRAFEEAAGLAEGFVADVAFSQPLFADAMLGRHTAEEWAAEIAARVADGNEQVDVDACVAMWLDTGWDVDDEVVTLIRGVKEAGQRVALFSNASTKLEADLDQMGVADLFDVVANSSRLGAVKPDRVAFEAVAERIGAAPERLLFVDDRAENVQGALDAGWHAVEMAGSTRLAAVLARLGIPGVDRTT